MTPKTTGSRADRWDRLIFEVQFGGERTSVKAGPDRTRAHYEIDAENRSLTIDFERGPDFEGRYRRVSSHRLQLRGHLGDDSVAVRLERIRRSP